MKKILLFLLLPILCFSLNNNSFAMSSTSYDTQKKKSHTKERSIQQRQVIDFKENTSTRSSSSKRSTSFVEVSLDSLIFAEIAKLELSREPYQSCRLITNPPLPADFGITAEAGSGIIDVYKAEYLAKAAQSNVNVSEIADTQKLKQYALCITQYAELVSKVLQNIQNSYNSITDLQKHISQLVSQYANVQSSILKQIQNINFNQCRFADANNRIQCSQLHIEIADMPKLMISKQKIFADSTYMNISSRFNIEKSVTSEFAKATEKATQTITEIAMSQKESVEKSKSSSATVRTPSLPQH